MFIHCCWWCCYFSYIVSKAVNNLLLLQLVWLFEARWRQLKCYLRKALYRLKSVWRLLTGQLMIISCVTDKPKWKQTCFIAALQKFIEPLYLWLSKGLIEMSFSGIYWHLKKTITKTNSSEKPGQDDFKLLSCILWSGLVAEASPSEYKTAL